MSFAGEDERRKGMTYRGKVILSLRSGRAWWDSPVPGVTCEVKPTPCSTGRAFLPLVSRNGMSVHCCWSPVQLQSICAALEGSCCLCETEITALLIYKAHLRYQDD